MQRRIDRLPGVRGFTLTELLVVIAIITILATITIPKLIGHIEKARVAASLANVKNAETSLNGMLSDAQVSKFQDFFTPPTRYIFAHLSDIPDQPNLTSIEHQELIYRTVFYLLLRLGRDAALEENINTTGADLRTLLNAVPVITGQNDVGDPFYFDPADGTGDAVFDRTVTNKLQTSYMDLGNDSWDDPFNFWMGPLHRGAPGTPVPLRSFRLNPTDPTLPFVWNTATRNLVRDAGTIGLPAVDDNTGQAEDASAPAVSAPGYPAPYDLAVYIWSNGPNKEQDAHLTLRTSTDPGYEGGGDDINNWDTEQGWSGAPRPQ